MARLPDPPGWRAQFALLSLTWGSSFLFIKVLDRHWPPLWVALGRIALGAVTLLMIATLRGERLRLDRTLWRHLAVVAVLFNAVPFVLFAYGETKIPSLVAGLWNATTPLWVLIAALLAYPEENPNRARVLGLLVGFLGVAVLLGPWRGLGHGVLIGHLACAAGAACYGIGFPYTRRHLAGRGESGALLAAGQLLCATAMLAIFVPFSRAPSVHIGLDGLGSLIALGAFGTGVAYVLNYAIVRAAGATVASTVTYLIPVFSTLLGALVLSESLHWNQALGMLTMLCGIAISQERLTLRRGSRELD